MKLFLTGKKQIGKSTAIRRVLAASGLRPGGFVTQFREEAGKQRLYICPAGESAQAPIPAAEGAPGKMRPLPGAFDRAGSVFLANRAEILILDELGHLEKDEAAFCAGVLQALDGPGPVLGVLREGFPGWTARIAAREDVQILPVTEENRDEIPALILKQLNSENNID